MPEGAEFSLRVGADENGLGARLGPLVVTAVLGRVKPGGERLFQRKLRGRITRDLGDSKGLVSHGNIALGEAWARVLTGDIATNPQELFERLSLEGMPDLTAPCPRAVEAQCWSTAEERFGAEPELVRRICGHVATLEKRGLEILRVKTSIVCTRRLNEAKERGGNRFTSDLHAMERLILALRAEAGDDVLAVCGKVGGIADYSRFFGPLSMRLHNVLLMSRPKSAYRFPGVGEVHFVQDADAKDPLVMLASLVGKYVREMLMHRVWRHYRPDEDAETVSGYHDPSTAKFVEKTASVRHRRRVPVVCFERTRDAAS
jgi:ribonuclease HII